MKRNMLLTLQSWKDSETRTPFYLTGIKGVGKTFLACEFAKTFFDSYLYINFEHNRELVSVLNQQPKEQIISILAKYFEFPEEYIENIPFIFDEIHYCPEVISKLLQFIQQNNKQYLHWIFISSYDKLAEQEKKELCCHTLYPLQYDEFLLALDKAWYIEVIAAHYKNHKKLPDIVHKDLLSTFDEYLWIGGMPDVLMEYIQMESSSNVRERQYIQKKLLLTSINKIVDEPMAYKCQQIYETIDEQLQKRNQKFQFTLIRKGITYQMYKEALEFLEKHHIVYRIDNIDGEKTQQFRIFYSDFALNTSIRSDEFSLEERYIRLQNYLYQTFAEKKIPCYFWEAKSQASLDFIIKTSDNYIPIELKQENRSKTKSIASFLNQYPFARNTIRISSENFVKSDENINIPIYSLFCFEN